MLVVDDNVDAAELLAEVLDGLGYQTWVANDGPTALRGAREFHPDVALLDIGLPVMDGYELARRLREDQALSALRIIAVTGYGTDSDRARSRAAGIDAHLLKPIDLARLQQVLERPT